MNQAAQAPSCIVITWFSDDQPGFLDFSYRIKSLARHYQRITVLSTAVLKQAELQAPGIEFVVLKGGHGLKGWLRYIWQCAAFVRRSGAQRMVALHSAVAPVTLLCPGTPSALYWNEHPTHFAGSPPGFSPIRGPIRALRRASMFLGARRSTLVMPIGEAHRDDLLAHGVRKDKLHMIYMGVDNSFAASSKPRAPRAADSPLRLVYVGSVQKARGRDVMLEGMAYAITQGANARLTIVGANAGELSYCNSYAAKLGIAEHVDIVGRVPGSAIPGYLHGADMGVCLWEDQPWWRFNPPTKLFEYLVAGLPVMASNIRTHTEYIRDGSNGIIFEYDSRSFGQAVVRVCAQAAMLAPMSQTALSESARYTWETIEPTFLTAIDQLARST